MENKSTDLIVTILIIVMIVGFYLVLTNIQETQDNIQEFASDIKTNLSDGTVSPGNQATSTDQEGDNNQNSDLESTSIQTAILFEAESSPLLEPQTDLTITIEEITKFEDGQVNVDIKAYTNNAEGYSALQPSNIFEVVDLSAGENQKPLKVEGAFDSIPPQSAVTGQVTFKVNESDEVILQIQSNEGTKNYRFNFETQNYEEAVLG